MSLGSGTRLGPYEILAPPGAMPRARIAAPGMAAGIQASRSRASDAIIRANHRRRRSHGRHAGERANAPGAAGWLPVRCVERGPRQDIDTGAALTLGAAIDDAMLDATRRLDSGGDRVEHAESPEEV